MGVHQTPDGRWYIWYRDRETGKGKKEYFGHGLQAEASARNRFSDLGIRGYSKGERPSVPTFIEVVKAYLSDKAESLSSSTVAGMVPKINAIYIPEFGRLAATSLDENRLRQFIDKRVKTVKRTTVHRELSDIRAILNWAVKKKILIHNPMVGLTFPRRDDERIRPPSAGEIRAIMEHAQEHLRRSIIIGWYCGLRMGEELFSRKWSDVDWEARTIYIISAEKGGLDTRRVPLANELCSVMLRWYANDGENDRLPIIHWRGKRIAKIKTAWRKALTKAGITRRIRPYDLRHSFCSDLLDSGVDPQTVGNIAGHKDKSTTLYVYHHTTSEGQRKAVEHRRSIL